MWLAGLGPRWHSTTRHMANSKWSTAVASKDARKVLPVTGTGSSRPLRDFNRPPGRTVPSSCGGPASAVEVDLLPGTTMPSCGRLMSTWPGNVLGPPEPPSAAIRARLDRQGQRDTKPELEIRRWLPARGVRFRVDIRLERDLRVRGDIVWSRRWIVVFVVGCF